MSKELIEWIGVDVQLPDDEMTVLINHPDLNEPVWMGYCCDGCWHDVGGGLLPSIVVTHWAEMPSGVAKHG